MTHEVMFATESAPATFVTASMRLSTIGIVRLDVRLQVELPSESYNCKESDAV